VEEFLRPWLPPAASARARHVVRLVFDVEALRHIEESRSAEPQRVPCFGLDTQVIERPAWPTPEGLVVDDARFGCHFRVEPARTTVFARPGDRRARVVAVRILRELAAAALAPSHWALHAAAVALEGRALVIAGSRGSGKTSLLVHLLLSTGAAFVANDWVWLRAISDGGFEAIGMPTIVAVRPGTVARFPRLLAGRAANGSFLPYTVAEIDAGLADGAVSPAEGALHLSPRQLAARTGAAVERGAPLAAIVLPQIDPDAREMRLEPIGPDAAIALLLACRHGSHGGCAADTIFGRRGAAPSSWDPIAARVPLFRFRLGPRAYACEGWARALERVLA